MKKRTGLIMGGLAVLGMVFLILDARTALEGARDGIGICVMTVIPTLFPFFVFSILLTGVLAGRRIPGMGPLCRLCGVPQGGEALLLVGFLGGYPVGAQSVAQAYRQGVLSQRDARRMLGFCNNAGPAFIFGMTAVLFHSAKVSWCLWGIHILSALFTAILLPGKSQSLISVRPGPDVSLPQALKTAVRVMAEVCGWVVLFRVIVQILDRWCLWLLPPAAKAAVIGLLELSNGCIGLTALPQEGTRYLLCAFFLGFGGICVAMQTLSVTGELGGGAYIPGKAVQSIFSLILAGSTQFLLFPPEQWVRIPGIFWASVLLLGGISMVLLKKSSGNPVKAVV